MEIIPLILTIIWAVCSVIFVAFFILSYVEMVRKIDEIHEKLGCDEIDEEPTKTK